MIMIKKKSYLMCHICLFPDRYPPYTKKKNKNKKKFVVVRNTAQLAS